MKKVFIGLFLLNIIFIKYLYAQLPETRIYIFDIEKQRNKFLFSNMEMVGFKKGYNNQPYFLPDGTGLLYSSNKGKNTTDIYRYLYKRKRNKRVTKTSEYSEFSPKLHVSQDMISCIRLERDSNWQRLYTYDLKGKNKFAQFAEITNFGYFNWLGNQEVISFHLPEPFTLQRINITTHRRDTLAYQPGRCIQVHQREAYYVDNTDTTNKVIRKIARENLRTRKDASNVENPIVANCLVGSEDFCIMNDDNILMAKGSKLYLHHVKKHKVDEWDEIFDFGAFGINKFNRIAINFDNKKLAIVVDVNNN